ncbi:MAG: hypothetical protein ACYTGZ_21160 [Planctomycetota bacterium]|jgi:hypothetical protein
MIRAILLSSALATLAPAAEAGDWRVIFGLGDRHGSTVRVKIGSKRSHDHDRRGRSDRNVRHRRHDDRHVDRHRSHRSHRGHRHHAPRYRTVTERVWVRGHFDRVAYKVRIPETHKRVRVPARYEWRTDRCGRRTRVLVRRAHWKTVCVPARYETRYKSVYHRGHYETRTKKIRI